MQSVKKLKTYNTMIDIKLPNCIGFLSSIFVGTNALSKRVIVMCLGHEEASVEIGLGVLEPKFIATHTYDDIYTWSDNYLTVKLLFYRVAKAPKDKDHVVVISVKNHAIAQVVCEYPDPPLSDSRKDHPIYAYGRWGDIYIATGAYSELIKKYPIRVHVPIIMNDVIVPTRKRIREWNDDV